MNFLEYLSSLTIFVIKLSPIYFNIVLQKLSIQEITVRFTVYFCDIVIKGDKILNHFKCTNAEFFIHMCTYFGEHLIGVSIDMEGIVLYQF